MSFADKLVRIVERYEQMTRKLEDPSSMSHAEFAKLAKEQSDVEQVAILAKNYIAKFTSVVELEVLIRNNTTEFDFKELAVTEKEVLNEEIKQITQELRLLLLPKDAADGKGAILEIRAGAGGEEAALFAAVLFRMYQKYAEKRKWKFEILSISNTGLDGYKEASACITGKGVFARLKFESGVHRVQRVPETESSGRIHTSTATVAVLPEAEEVDIYLEEKDLKIDVYRASGAGGQHVNTTDSAVRVTHIPTGIVVCQQDEKSQHKNKAKALKILRSRLYEAERIKKEIDRSVMRKGQVGTGDRSERIRTYNYPQSRVTDHRINMTLYSLNTVTNEGTLDEFIDALIAEDQSSKLAAQDE
ncbi:Peptide chain release factor 1 [Alphaproteobacteria bacterium]